MLGRSPADGPAIWAVGVGVDPTTDDAGRVDPDQLGDKVPIDPLSTLRKDLRPPAHLDPARLPRR